MCREQVQQLSDGWHDAQFLHTANAVQCASQFLQQALDGLHVRLNQASLGDMAAVLVTLRNLKDAAGRVETEVNKVLPAVAEVICRAIATANMFQFATRTHMFTASADAYLTASPRYGTSEHQEVLDWLAANVPGYDTGEDALVRMTFDRKGYERLCRGLYEDGKELPPHTEMYIRPAITVRRRPNRDK